MPVKLYNLAQEFKENNPQVVMRVLDQHLPMIRDRIGKLDVQDELISNFSDELDKLDDEGYQDRKAGLIKVNATTYGLMKQELTMQDKHFEDLRLEYNQLERQYRKLRKQNTRTVKGETSALTKEDETLLARTARMESKLELLRTRLREQAKAMEAREHELLQAKVQADLEAQRWRKAAEAHERQLQMGIRELYTLKADHQKQIATLEAKNENLDEQLNVVEPLFHEWL